MIYCFVFLIQVTKSQIRDDQDLQSESKPLYNKTSFIQAVCPYESSHANLGNGVCNDYLNTKECGWDLGDCGYCSKNCFFYMLNNGICDEECFTKDCEFDYLDCIKNSSIISNAKPRILNQKSNSSNNCVILSNTTNIYFSYSNKNKTANFSINLGDIGNSDITNITENCPTGFKINFTLNSNASFMVNSTDSLIYMDFYKLKKIIISGLNFSEMSLSLTATESDFTTDLLNISNSQNSSLTLYNSNGIITNSYFDTKLFILLISSNFSMDNSLITACSSQYIAELKNSTIKLTNTRTPCQLQINYDNSIDYCNLTNCTNKKCDPGHARYNGLCMPCPDDTYAVQNDNITDKTCFECTNNMTCNANLIKPVPGV